MSINVKKREEFPSRNNSFSRLFFSFLFFFPNHHSRRDRWVAQVDASDEFGVTEPRQSIMLTNRRARVRNKSGWGKKKCADSPTLLNIRWDLIEGTTTTTTENFVPCHFGQQSIHFDLTARTFKPLKRRALFSFLFFFSRRKKPIGLAIHSSS